MGSKYDHSFVSAYETIKTEKIEMKIDFKKEQNRYKVFLPWMHYGTVIV